MVDLGNLRVTSDWNKQLKSDTDIKVKMCTIFITMATGRVHVLIGLSAPQSADPTTLEDSFYDKFTLTLSDTQVLVAGEGW